jgi:integrase
MPRETSPFIVGDYWLDKRRDGASPDIWQIATYAGKSRSVIYRSTKRRTVELEQAKAVLRAYEAEQRSTAKWQDADDAQLLPHLFNYLREHGPDVHRLDTVKSSFRAWIGFLMQDQLGTGATIADIDKISVARFRRWRMGPHSWEVEWADKVFSHKSDGVTGQTVQRNIEDLRAALHHAEAAKRFEAPKVPSVDKKLRQKQREPMLLSTKVLGALWAYAKDDEGMARELALMLATACRPGAAMAFNPSDQWVDELIDLQPDGRPLTDKRNAVCPMIEPLRPILTAWKDKPHDKVKSRKRWWRTARRALGTEAEAYDIRHTVSTMLDHESVPGAQISGLTGHMPASRNVARTTSKHYLHYDPANAPQLKRALTKFFLAVQREAALWSADHLRTKPVRGKPIMIERVLEKC